MLLQHETTSAKQPIQAASLKRQDTKVNFSLKASHTSSLKNHCNSPGVRITVCPHLVSQKQVYSILPTVLFSELLDTG